MILPPTLGVAKAGMGPNCESDQSFVMAEVGTQKSAAMPFTSQSP